MIYEHVVCVDKLAELRVDNAIFKKQQRLETRRYEQIAFAFLR
jgi:hypothetical protein